MRLQTFQAIRQIQGITMQNFRIFKYPVSTSHNPDEKCLFPACGKIVNIDTDYNGMLSVWVLLPEDQIDVKENYVYTLATGEESGNLYSEDYIKTVILNETFVWHLFLAHKN